MIRTLEQLQEEIDKEHAWRKKELSLIRSYVSSNPKGPLLSYYLRSGLALLYAHWEGFIKAISEDYLEFIALQKLSHKELNSCFIAIAVRGKLNSFGQTDKVSLHINIVNSLIDSLSGAEQINWKHVIQTKSNLNSTTLKEIIMSLGLNYLPFELKANLIDEQLLKSRNKIAHGEFYDFENEKKQYDILHLEVLGMMVDFNNQIILSANNKSYLRKTPVSI